jgi:phosphatidylserine/phosphatidylglycerophosphate/cardiolipin synthase-like enzyme
MEDQMVVDELRSVAYSGKVAVFVISNRNKREDEEYISTKEKKDVVDAEGIHAHRMFLQRMYYSGVHVRLLDNLHAKFIIADGQKGVLMSANIASNSLNKNVETGISVEGDDLKSLELVFDTMYNYADIVQFVQSDRSDVVKMSVKKLPNQIFEGIKGNIRLTAISRNQTNLSECKQTSIYDSIIKIIDEAGSFIYIVAWVFKDKRGALSKLKYAIDRAAKRGVKVALLYNDKGNTANKEIQQKYIYEMGRIGCDAYSVTNNHSKCVLSDKSGMLFTANIDGNNGLLEGFEVGCLLDEEQYRQAVKHIEELIKIAKR